MAPLHFFWVVPARTLTGLLATNSPDPVPPPLVVTDSPLGTSHRLPPLHDGPPHSFFSVFFPCFVRHPRACEDNHKNAGSNHGRELVVPSIKHLP